MPGHFLYGCLPHCLPSYEAKFSGCKGKVGGGGGGAYNVGEEEGKKSKTVSPRLGSNQVPQDILMNHYSLARYQMCHEEFVQTRPSLYNIKLKHEFSDPTDADT